MAYWPYFLRMHLSHHQAAVTDGVINGVLKQLHGDGYSAVFIQNLVSMANFHLDL